MTLAEITTATQTKAQILSVLDNVQKADDTVVRIQTNKTNGTAKLKAFIATPEAINVLGNDYDVVKTAIEAL